MTENQFGEGNVDGESPLVMGGLIGGGLAVVLAVLVPGLPEFLTFAGRQHALALAAGLQVPVLI